MAYDGFLATLDYSDTNTKDAADSNLKLAVAGTGGATSFKDIRCTYATVTGKYDAANCILDSANTVPGTDTDWTP